MSLFNVSIKEPIKRDKKELLDSFYTKLIDNEEYETTKDKNSFKIQKCKLDTFLKFNTKVEATSNELVVEAELHDTLLLTIIIVLAILLTYGIGVVIVVVYAYLQKRKATSYLREILHKINFND